MKILHFADAHARDRDIDEIAKCLGFIVAKAREERPDLIIFAGDAFHSRDVRLDSQAARWMMEIFSQLADIAPVAAVLGTPSHDGRAPEILSMVRGNFPIHVATVPEQVYLLPGGALYTERPGIVTPDAVISLVPQPTKEFFVRSSGGSIAQTDQDIAQAMGAIFMGFGGMAAQFPNVPHILVMHGTVKGSVTSTGQVMIGREIEVSKEQLELARADLVCAGHIHKEQKIEPNIYYSGSIYRENWGEQEAKGFYVHHFEHGAIFSNFIETPTKKLARVSMDTTTEGYDLAAGLADTDFSGASVRVEIKVYQDEAAEIGRAEIEQELKGKGAAEVEVRIVRVPRETVRSSAVIHLHSLRDKILELARTRGEEVAPEILEKADILEQEPVEQVLERVGGVA